MNVAADFLDGLSAELRIEAETCQDLESLLLGFYQKGRAAWPSLTLTREEFLSGLAAAAGTSPPKKGLQQWLEHVQPGDFYLAQACRLSRSGALECFERAYQKDFERLIRKYEGPELPAEDLLQKLREKLFVSTETRQARIGSYSGQGLLQNWLRVTAARLCIDMLRSASRRQDKELLGNDEKLLNMPDSLQNLELNFLKREYQSQFKEAFAIGVNALEPHERNLLRQHLIHLLTVEQLGRLYGVHASTISRRVTKAREKLLAETRSAFMARLRLNSRDFDSIMVIIRSQLDLSMPRLLKSTITESEEKSPDHS